jgi:OmpA-OmpF porin, OOP family
MPVQKCLVFWAFFVGAACTVWAQATPTPEQMVEQLKAPRTRSLRNLTVEAVPAPPAAATAPTPTSATTAMVPTAPPTSVAPNAAPAAAAPSATGPATAGAATALPVARPGAASPALAPEPRPSLSLLIQFDFNSARVKPESQQALANLATALKSADLLDSKFAVEGHTDAKGRADYNLRLSQQRADAVRDTLVAQGVAPQRLRSAGKGANELANSADPGAAENRRVRIINLD